MTFTEFLMKNMSCRRFARHVAREVEPLEGGLYRRLHFWFHWCLCPFCRSYWREIKAIGSAHRAVHSLSAHPVVKLNDVKTRLKEKLRERFPRGTP